MNELLSRPSIKHKFKVVLDLTKYASKEFKRCY